MPLASLIAGSVMLSGVVMIVGALRNWRWIVDPPKPRGPLIYSQAAIRDIGGRRGAKNAAIVIGIFNIIVPLLLMLALISRGQDQPLRASDDTYTVEKGQTLEVGIENGLLSNDKIPDGVTVTASWIDGPARGDLELNEDGTFTYTPEPDGTGSDRFRYRISDGERSDLAEVKITVEKTHGP